MKAYKVIKPGTNSNTIVKELNAAVLLATFEIVTGIQAADLYSSVNSANKLVKKGTTAPINDTYVGTVYLDFGSSSKPGSDKPGIVISDGVAKLSTAGIISILSTADHVSLFGDETRLELMQILQLNLNDDLIDILEVLTVLSGE